MPLAPGTIYTQRLLLNQWFLIDRPGRYHVSANRELRFGGRMSNFGLLLACDWQLRRLSSTPRSGASYNPSRAHGGSLLR